MVQRKGTVGGVPTNKTIRHSYLNDKYYIDKNMNTMTIAWTKEQKNGTINKLTNSFTLNKDKRWELFDEDEEDNAPAPGRSTALKKERKAKNQSLKKLEHALNTTKDKHLKRQIKKEQQQQQQRLKANEEVNSHTDDDNCETTSANSKGPTTTTTTTTFVDVVKFGLDMSNCSRRTVSKKNRKVVELDYDDMDQKFENTQAYRDAGYELRGVKVTKSGDTEFTTNISTLHPSRMTGWEKFRKSEDVKSKQKQARDWKTVSLQGL